MQKPGDGWRCAYICSLWYLRADLAKRGKKLSRWSPTETIPQVWDEIVWSSLEIRDLVTSATEVKIEGVDLTEVPVMQEQEMEVVLQKMRIYIDDLKLKKKKPMSKQTNDKKNNNEASSPANSIESPTTPIPSKKPESKKRVRDKETTTDKGAKRTRTSNPPSDSSPTLDQFKVGEMVSWNEVIKGKTWKYSGKLLAIKGTNARVRRGKTKEVDVLLSNLSPPS